MKKPISIISLLLLTIVIMSVVRIFISNKISTSGTVLGNVQEQVAYYQLQNSLLSEKLYEVSSLTNIEEKATKLGYVEQQNEFVLNGQLPVALKQ